MTLNATTAQKQNLGQTRIRGVQTDVEYRIGSFWRVTGAYVYDQAKVTDGGVANAALVGKYVPQVPLHRGSFQVAYSNPRYATVAFSMQALSLQYNDDQNVQFIPAPTLAEAGYNSFTGPGLPGYASVDLHRSCATSGATAGVLRRPEHVRQGVVRADQPVDDGNAPPDELRRAGQVFRTIRQRTYEATEVQRPQRSRFFKQRSSVRSASVAT